MKKFPSRGQWVHIILLLLIGSLASPTARAACSEDYYGLAIINEVYKRSQGNTNEYFLETKVLSSSIDSTIYDQWTIESCTNAGCSGPISLSNAPDAEYPWLVVDQNDFSPHTLVDINVGNFVILRDARGDTIDYLSVNGFTTGIDTSCTPAFEWEYSTVNNNTKNVRRVPDGVGNFSDAPGNSNSNTEGDTNTGGGSGPDISIDSVSVQQGETATFTLSVNTAYSTNISISYQTQDRTATAGTDYVSSAGTVVIPAGSTQVTVQVPTLSSGSSVEEEFWLVLGQASAGSIVGQIGVGTIASGTSPPEYGYIIGGNHGAFSSQNGSWAWDGSQLSAFRSAVEDDANFGSGGVVGTNVVTVDQTMDADGLAGIDAFFSTWWDDDDAVAYADEVEDFFRSGGDLVLLQDDSSHDLLGARLGFPTQQYPGWVCWFYSCPPVTSLAEPIQDERFGTVGQFQATDAYGYLIEADVLAAGGTVCGRDSFGNVTVACWDEGEFAPGAGKLVIATDVDFLTGPNGGADYTTPNDKGLFGLNLVSYLLSSDLPPPPVGYWAMEDVGGYDGSAGEVSDQSGNGLNGRTANGVVQSNLDPARSGNPGTCDYAEFDRAEQRYIEIADSDALDIASNLTISAWVYPQSLPSSGLMTILSKDENYEFHLNASGQINWWWNAASGTIQQLTTSSTRVATNVWTHIVITYRNGAQQIFVNGVESATGSFTGGLRTNSDPLYIGQDQFSSGRYFDGRIDEVKIFDSVLSNSQINALYTETHPCPDTGDALAAFRIATGTTASTCAPHPVQIEALDGSGSTLTDYTGTVELSTSKGRGTWTVISGAGTLAPDPDTSDDGAASYAFDPADAGVVVLGLANDVAEALTMTVTDTSAVISETSAEIQFSDNVLYVEESDAFDMDIIAGRNHAFQVSMIARDPTTDNCGLVEEYDGPIGLKAWLSRDAADPGGVAPQMSGSSVATMPSTEPSAANISLDFSNGQASFQWLTSDVGKYILNLKDDSSGLVLDATGQPVTVVSDHAFAPWIVRPFALRVEAVGNPGTSNATGAVYRAAGETFPLRVYGLQYQAGDDANNDGAADVAVSSWADLTDNNTTPSFGGEGEGATVFVETATNPSSLVAPASGVLGTLGVSGFAFNSTVGALEATASYSEVGAALIRAEVTDGDYLGAGSVRSDKIFGWSEAVGRFTPAYLDLTANTPSVRAPWSCGFVYQGQPFEIDTAPVLTVTGKNAAGATTLNYDSNYYRFSDSQNGRYYTDNSGTPSVLTATTTVLGVSHNSGTAYDGVGTMTVNDSLFLHEKTNLSPAAGDAPFNANFSLTLVASDLVDADGICYQSSAGGGCEDFTVASISGVEIRYGRLSVENAFGPETVSLQVPWQLEYWDGASFLLNTADNCSSFPAAVIDVNGSAGDFANVAIGSGTTSMSRNNPVVAGDANMVWSAPGAGNTGTLQLQADLTALPWLQYDRDGNGSLDSQETNPSRSVTFGQYRGHDRIIYWREVLD